MINNQPLSQNLNMIDMQVCNKTIKDKQFGSCELMWL